jgi:hypothetical protein
MREIEAKAKTRDNIRLLDPVPMTDIVRSINRFDIGMHIMMPSNFNHANALPNKFFEFIQARIAVAIGPTPEMKRLTDQYELGVVAKDFSSETMAKSLNSITTEDLEKFKRNSGFASRELNSSINKKIIRRLAVDVLRAYEDP